MDYAVPTEYVETLKKRNFHIEKAVARGAFGYVCRAIQVPLGRPVAVKFLDGLGMRDESNRKRFEREGPLLARLEHPSIPYVLTTGTVRRGNETTPYIVMQFIHGTRLADLIESQEKIDAVNAIKIMRHVLSALACAHRGHIIHRDVAPENIIVGEQNTHLIDFSIGVCTKYEPGLTRSTSLGERVGRGDYASPEQKVDSSTVDNRTDIYSAGVVLFEMLAGHPRIKLTGIDKDLGHVPVELRNVVRTACAQEKDARYTNADAFLEALNRFVEGPGAVIGVPTMSLCPNRKCGGANWSTRGYFRGPRVEDNCSDSHCKNCGTSYIKSCKKCRAPLPKELPSLVSKSSKSANEYNEAHCSRCGTLIFQTPTCETCGSFLKKSELDTDTKNEGCSKCRSRNQPSPPSTIDDDIEIPF